MHYAQLGRSGLTVSRICLGTLTFGDKAWRPWMLDESAARTFFRRALDAGINFFDTADMYSLGESERITGRLLGEMANRDEIVLATKAYFPMSDKPNMRGLSRKHLMQACEASLRRLGVDTIDLYYIHRFDEKTPIDETLSALDLLVNQGKVRYVGASAGAAWEFARAVYLARHHDWPPFIAMQNHYNLLYREDEREMIPFCLAERIGCVPYSPLARGLLARGRPHVDDPSTTRARTDQILAGRYDSANDAEILSALRTVSEGRATPPAEVALAWILGRPGVVAPIIGATKVEHIDSAVRALETSLTEEERDTLESGYRAHPVRD
jgi:aryl-alcohol dehydrogenase-like predicted oxidoreductase